MENRRLKHDILETGVFIKGITGCFELIIGLIVLFANSLKINNLINIILRPEILEDKNDLIANTLINIASNISIGTKEFIGAYILIHGIINLFLFFVIWGEKKRLFPLSLVILLVLTLYQIYRFYHTHSVFLFFLTLVDMVIIYLLADYIKDKSK